MHCSATSCSSDGAPAYRLEELAYAAHLRDSCRDRGICRDKENPNVLTFTIDRNNRITALNSTPQAQVNPEAARFSGFQDLGRLTKSWPGARLVEIWNLHSVVTGGGFIANACLALFGQTFGPGNSQTAEPPPPPSFLGRLLGHQTTGLPS
jgi:hypothetical protein